MSAGGVSNCSKLICDVEGGYIATRISCRYLWMDIAGHVSDINSVDEMHVYGFASADVSHGIPQLFRAATVLFRCAPS